MVSDFKDNWYLGVFWSEELVGNDEICSQFHFYEATIFKMAANKIVKLSMVWFQWKLISRDFEVRNWLVHWILIWGLFGNFCVCIQAQSNLVIIITSPRLLSGDVLLFHVSFSLLLHHPDCCRVMYCYSTFLFHYYYVTPNAVEWRIAILRFFFTIIIIILIIIIIILPHIFVRSISRRCLDQTLWNLVGISYAMWS